MSNLDLPPLSSVRATGVPDAAGPAVPDEALDRLTRLAARLLGAPAAIVSLAGDGRQIVVGPVDGAEPAAWARRGTPLGQAFGRHVVDSAAPLVVEDARAHPLGGSSRSAEPDAVVAYAGMPLTTAGGQVLGSLAVLDAAPRRWTAADLETLADLARAVTAHLECRAGGRAAAEPTAAPAPRLSEAGLRAIVAHAAVGVSVVDDTGEILLTNPAFDAFLGYGPGALVGRRAAELAQVEDRDAVRGAVADLRSGRVASVDVEPRLVRRDGGVRRASLTLSLLPLGDGRDALLAVATDVTDRARALRESEAHFRGVFEQLRAATLQLDAEGRVTFANDALLELIGRTREETLGADWFAHAMTHPTASRARYTRALARGEIAPYMEREILTSAGERRVVAWDNVLLRDADGRVTGVASVGQDVTKRRALEARLAALSEHDELTGLLNRRGFWRLAEHALKATARGRRHDAVLYVDLERFTAINDAHGHAAGDEALRAVARVIRATIRDADLSARFGGDDFAVYALGLNAGDGEVLAARLRAKLEAHNVAASAAGRPFRIALSIGVAELEPGDDLDALLARADAALCALKLARRAWT